MILLAQAYSPEYLAFWTIAIGGTCAAACSLLGCFLLLRRMSLLGDALSHGILPGIALAVMVTGTLTGPVLFLGAMAFGLLTALLAQVLNHQGGVSEDASLGVVFTSLFALGVLLITRFLRHVEVDTHCIFFGLLDGVAFNPTTYFGWEVPEAYPTQALTFLLALGFILLFWKELKLSTFDPALAGAMGFRPGLMHFLLIALVAGTTVSAFAVVGSILVLAMLIVPPATALLLTDRLAPMLAWAAGLAFSAAALAYWLASPTMLASTMAGMMAVVSGAQLLLAVLFAPRHGVLARLVRRLRLSLRIAIEEVLASLYRREEGAPTALENEFRSHGLSHWLTRLAFWRLRRARLIRADQDGTYHLTPPGRDRALEVVRAHRLWESFLNRHFDLPPDHLHAPASRVEHFIGPQLRGELARQLDQPATDPHGRVIPPGESPSS